MRVWLRALQNFHNTSMDEPWFRVKAADVDGRINWINIVS